MKEDVIKDPKSDLWTEKYRPRKLDDLVLTEEMRSIINKFLAEQTIPHLLLVGNVGCGKTTIAKILLSALDCDSLELNASSERGIDVLRTKIKQFAMMSTTHKWKIVFLDEADGLTVDSQGALRNTMETYSNHCRFILTGNYRNKIMDAIASRCQVLEFNSLDKRVTAKLLRKILENEGVTYDVEQLLLLVEEFYPDLRGMINAIQLNTTNGAFQYRKSIVSEGEAFIKQLKAGNLAVIRKMNLDYIETLRLLFDKVEDLTPDYEKRVQASLAVADALYQDSFCPDKEINFAACCLRIMQLLNIRALLR